MRALLPPLSLAAIACLCLPAQAQDAPVPAQPHCKDGKLVGFTLFVPIPGLVTVRIDPDLVCAGTRSPADQAPAKQAPSKVSPPPAEPLPPGRQT